MRKLFNKHSITFVLAVLLALGLTPSLAWARPSATQLAAWLNGTPSRLGVITTNATTVTNATTAAPFVLAAGTLIKVQCDAAAFITVNLATASATYTAADIGAPILAGGSLLILLPDQTSAPTIAQFSAAAANCVVFRML